jgi:hypothetical protein
MSYDFTTPTTSRINHGSGATLDRLAYNGGASDQSFAVWAWVKRTANGANQYICSKNGTSNGWLFVVDSSPGEGSLRFIQFTGTATNHDYTSVAGVVPAGTWKLVAVAVQTVVSGQTVKIFVGDTSTSMAEVSYNTQTNGTGSVNDDSAIDLMVGNRSTATFNLGFKGLIARMGVIDGGTTAIPMSTFETIRGYNESQASSCNVTGTVLLADYGTAGSSQTDLSGNSNTGTVTDAVYSSDSPWASSSTAVPVFMSQYRRRR